MGKVLDVTGEKYNMLIITGLAPSKREPSGALVKRVYTVCECGNTNESSYKKLKRGLIKSCGCINESKKLNVSIGDTFNHWTLIKELEKRNFLVRCVCGNERVRELKEVYSGRTKSCGCKGAIKKVREKVPPQNTKEEIWKQSLNHQDYYISTLGRLFNYKHQIYIQSKRLHEPKGKKSIHVLKEMAQLFLEDYDENKHTVKCISSSINLESLELVESKTARYRKLENVYGAMKYRCYNKNSPDYKRYGGRGIIIEESFNTFNKFFVWSINNGFIDGEKLAIDRINNDKNYSADNCRWTTQAENNRNTSTTILNWDLVDKIRYGEYKEMSLKEVATKIGCSTTAIYDARRGDTWVN